MPGNSFYYTKDNYNSIQDKKFKKFQKKGISKQFIASSKLGIRSDNYINKCLKKRLIPFMEQNHNEKTALLWPDKATSHNAKKTLQFLKKKFCAICAKKISILPIFHNEDP